MGIDWEFWKGKRVFVTGHTGFKGAWLSVLLGRAGAHVTGYSLDPPTSPSMFAVCRVGERLASDHRADICSLDTVKTAIADAKPDVVFHMAAQSLVREGYDDPVGTYAANVMGTANVLEACRKVDSLRAILVITTDKCYENREWVHAYREPDALGGNDPYSSSKACAELVTSAFRTSFFNTKGASGPVVASVRAGNVIGGGDWAKDRLVPDCIRAFQSGLPVELRYPNAVRPWQHVLDPIAGYMILAQNMMTPGGAAFAAGWNFGPDPAGEADVLTVAQGVAEAWGNGAVVKVIGDAPQFKEANLLRLDSTKARVEIGWRPRWKLDQALEQSAVWYRAWHEGQNMLEVSLAQIEKFDRAVA